MPVLIQVSLVFIFVYLAATVFIFFNQRKMMYAPEKRVITPYMDTGFSAQDVILTTADGLKLKAAYRAPKDSTYPTILYFHGNTGTVQDAMHKLIPIVDAGYGVLMPEYRGYGGNSGKPSEKGLILDAEAALDFIYEHQGENTKVIYYGMSMGTGIANALAEKYPPAGLIQECGFTSMIDAAKHKMPYLPISMLLKDSFKTHERIKSLTSPLLVLHGKRDKTVPFEQGEIIYNIAPTQDKTFKVYEKGHHIDLYDCGASNDVLEWLNSRFIPKNL